METDQLKARVQELEAELAALRTAKDDEVQRLQDAVSAGQTALQEERAHSTTLAKDVRDAEVMAELERHRALDALRREHEHALERERQLVAEEKRRAEQWISDIKKGFQVERRNLLEQIERLEAPDGRRGPAPESGEVPASVEEEPVGEHRSTVPSLTSGGELGGVASGDVASASVDVASVVVGESASEPVGSVVGVEPAGSQVDLMQSMTELLRAQVQAMTQAAAAQSLPLLACYNGEGSQTDEEGVDRWLEQFVERGQLAGWTDEVKLCQLKSHLEGMALHAFRMFPKEDRSTFRLAAEALRKMFRPVDIEELRGLEFHRKTQVDGESVEQLGLELQRLGRRAFPSMEGSKLDRLLKGRFFQALHTKWQRKLGAPKPSESFSELYDRARMMEHHDKQYSATAAAYGDAKKPSQGNNTRNNRPIVDPKESGVAGHQGTRRR